MDSVDAGAFSKAASVRLHELREAMPEELNGLNALLALLETQGKSRHVRLLDGGAGGSIPNMPPAAAGRAGADGQKAGLALAIKSERRYPKG